jgi:alpha/beta superfamily hydrolase
MSSGSNATEATTVDGPAGALEALIEMPSGGEPAFVAVVCHPHPLFGGTMTNKVAHILARSFNEAGAIAVRFNYRGVGASAGGYDEGRGETDDTLAVLDWAAERWPRARLALAGFSFGGAVAIRAASARQDVQRLVTVAPAVDRVAVSPEALPRCPWLLLQGDRDELVDPGAVSRWVAALAKPPEVVVLAGAEHFFHGRLNDIRAHVVEWLQRVSGKIGSGSSGQ